MQISLFDGSKPMKEIFKPIKNYEGLFEISNYGRIKSCERKVSNHTGIMNKPMRMLKPQVNKKGYLIVRLMKGNNKKTLTIHRLVALHFISNPLNLPMVNHIDGNKQNAMITNLEWANNSINQKHAYKNGLNKWSGKAGRKPRAVVKLTKNGIPICEYPSIAEAGRTNKLNQYNIRSVCEKTRNFCGDFKWKYAQKGGGK